MHWIRIDRYYEGEIEAPGASFPAGSVQHCEQAPCESSAPSARPYTIKRAST